jgi:hypothetical protein
MFCESFKRLGVCQQNAGIDYVCALLGFCCRQPWLDSLVLLEIMWGKRLKVTPTFRQIGHDTPQRVGKDLVNYFPKRRWRAAYARSARKKSTRRKSGQ